MLPIVAPPTFATVTLAVEILERPIVSLVTLAFSQFRIVTLALLVNNVLITLTPTLALVKVHVDPVWDCGPSVKLLATAIKAAVAVMSCPKVLLVVI